MKKSVIIVAGGKGLRMGAAIPKQFMLLAGRPVLFHTLEAFYAFDPDLEIVLVLPEDQQAYWKELCASFRFSIAHKVVTGGETRFHSVKNGLDSISGEALIAVHDGVRPLVSNRIIRMAYVMAEQCAAAYPVIPVTDSLREYAGLNESIPVDRSRYCLVQTPQIFRSDVLRKAYEQEYRNSFTDDVSVVEASGMAVPVMVEGDKENLKITTSSDLIIAEALMECRI